MTLTPTNTVDLQELADTAQELMELIGEFTRVPRSRLQWGPLAKKTHQHMKLAISHMKKIEMDSAEAEPGPALGGSIHQMISRQIDSMSRGMTMAAARPIEPSSSPAPTGRQQGFHGHTDCLGISELVDCLSLQRKEGVLEVRCDGEVISLWFEKGDVVHATSNHNPPNRRLGDILVDEGIIGREQLDDFLFRHATSELRVGDLLVQRELVTLDQLRSALSIQVRDIFERLQNAISADYSFFEGLPQDFGEQIRLSVTYLLLESARRVDESGPTSS